MAVRKHTVIKFSDGRGLTVAMDQSDPAMVDDLRLYGQMLMVLANMWAKMDPWSKEAWPIVQGTLIP